MNLIKLTICVGLGGIAIGCGPHQGANVTHFIDCVGDGCDSSYQEKVDEFRGSDGAAGEAGSKGERGARGVAGADGRDGQAGPRGADGQDGEDGADGQDGQDGQDGVDGQDGTSCTIIEVAEEDGGGAVITCGDESVYIEDGEDGASVGNYDCYWVSERIKGKKTKIWRCTSDDS